MFAENSTTYMLNKFNDSIGIHTWNSKRNFTKIDNEPGSAYSVLGAKYCPKSIALGGKDF